MLHVQPRFQKTNIHTRCMHSYSFRKRTNKCCMYSHGFKRQTYKSGACTVTASGNEQTNAACTTTVSKDKHTHAVHAQLQLQKTHILYIRYILYVTHTHNACATTASNDGHSQLSLSQGWDPETTHLLLRAGRHCEALVLARGLWLLHQHAYSYNIHIHTAKHTHSHFGKDAPVCCFVLAGTARPLYWPGGRGCCTNMHTPITYTYTQPNTHTLTLARTCPSAASCWQAMRGPCTGQEVIIGAAPSTRSHPRSARAAP